MRDYRRLALLVLIMTVVAATMTGTTIVILYDVAFEEQRERLIETVRGQARLMESVARFDQQHSDYPGGPRAATLVQIETAHRAFQSREREAFQLLLGEIAADGIHFVLGHGDAPGGSGASVPWNSDLAEPMRRALAGQSGSMVARDLRGDPVLAAFEPVAVLDLGVVAEMPIAEIRRPFARAGWIVSLVGVGMVLLGIMLFFAVGEAVTRRLRENDALYRRLFDQSPSAKFILDPQTRLFVSVNDALAGLVGYTRQELTTLPLSTFEAKETPAEIEAHVAQVLAQGNGDFETLWRTKAGQLLTVAINAFVLAMGGRRVIFCVLTDITARINSEKRARDLQDQLQRATRANELGQMVSSLTHELKQPLTASLNYINATRRFLQTGDEAARVRAMATLAKAGEQITRADHFIRGLRDYMQHKNPVRVAEDINPVVVEAIEVASAGSRGVRLRMNLAPGLPQILIDRMQIQQVLVNLLRNAIEAVAHLPRPQVVVETTLAADQSIEIAVHDSGPGLTAEVRERLFQPFVTTKADGLGIGLSISHAIVLAHHGRLWAEDADDHGATFRLSLCIIPPEPCEHPVDGAAA